MADGSDTARRRERVVEGLRAFASVQSEMGRLFARSRQMHVTDATAIVEILTAEGRGQPLTPARLAERIALTTGATSILLNRLEDAGHIRRTRESSDRRIVTLRSTPAVHASSDAFFEPLTRRLDVALDGYSAADLDVVLDLVDRLRTTMRTYMDLVAATPPQE